MTTSDTRAPVGVPRMTANEVQAMEVLIADALNFWSEDGTLVPWARNVEKLVTELATDRLRTYSPESEVRISREEVRRVESALLVFAETLMEKGLSYHSAAQQSLAETVRGWLVSTKQEVSE